LVRQSGIDAILAQSTPAAIAAHQATQTIPIVAVVGVDPVATGSLAHPGGNVTGIAIWSMPSVWSFCTNSRQSYGRKLVTA
jgi:putative ABC transport system substrate-binding protein